MLVLALVPIGRMLVLVLVLAVVLGVEKWKVAGKNKAGREGRGKGACRLVISSFPLGADSRRVLSLGEGSLVRRRRGDRRERWGRVG